MGLGLRVWGLGLCFVPGGPLDVNMFLWAYTVGSKTPDPDTLRLLRPRY